MRAKVAVIDFKNRESKTGFQFQILQCFATVGDSSGIAEMAVFNPECFVDGDGEFVADWKVGIDRESKVIEPQVAYLKRIQPGQTVDFGVQEAGIQARFSALVVKEPKPSKASKRLWQQVEGVCHTDDGKLVGFLHIYDPELFITAPGEYGLEWQQSRSWKGSKLGGRLVTVKPLAGQQSLASMMRLTPKPAPAVAPVSKSAQPAQEAAKQ